MDAERFRHTNIPAPPAGATVALRPAGFVASVSTRDPRAWILLLFFVVFGGGVAGGLYGSQIVSGKWDFLESMLGLPLLAGAMLVGWQGMMQTWGRITVVRDGDAGRIEQGAGWVVLTRRFRWPDLRGVEVVERSKVKQIVLQREAGDLRFGGLLDEAGRGYLIAVIRAGMRG